jgi:hypothetical protein
MLSNPGMTSVLHLSKRTSKRLASTAKFSLKNNVLLNEVKDL